jgi:drug/metabolite transporter (DMT)-like permease
LLAILIGQLAGLLIALLLVGGSAEPFPGARPLGPAVIAGLCGVGGLGGFYLALARGTMGLVAPLVGVIAAALPAIVGIASGDRADPAFLAGIGVALMAILIIALPDRQLGTEGAPVRGRRSVMGELGLVAIAGLGFAGFFVFIDASHDAGAGIWWPIFVVRVTGITAVLVTLVTLMLLHRAPVMRAPPRVVVTAGLAGAGDVGGNVFFLLAAAASSLAVAGVLSSLYPVTTTLMARVVLGERLGPVRSAGVVLALVGMVLISLGASSSQ